MIGFYAAGAMGQGGITPPPPEPWTPAHLSVAPKIWLDWGSSVTDVSGAASEWVNRGSLGGALVQATAGFRPTILASELNGRRVLRFDGTDDGMYGDQSTFASLFRNVGYGMALAVYKKRTTDGSGQNRVIFRAPWGTANRGVRFDIQCADPAAANAFRLGVRRLDSDSFSSLVGDASSGAWSIAVADMRWAEGFGAVYQNGSETGRNASLTSAGNTSNTAGAYDINVGFFHDVSAGRIRFADIDLAALVVLGETTGMDRQRLEGWYAWECGLHGALNPEHPYRYDPPYVMTSPLSFTDRTAEATLSVPFVQGVEVDGVDAWVTSSGETTVLRRYSTSTWTVAASASFSSLTPGFSPTSLGDPTLYDGVLYIPCGVYADGGSAYVIEVDPVTLDYIDHHDLSAHCSSGINSIVRYGGKWYVGETANNDPDAVPALRRFDDDFTYDGEVWSSSSGLRIDFNGAAMIGSGPLMVAGGHGGSLFVFDLTKSPALVDELPMGLVDVQGVSYDGGRLYVSYRSGGQKIDSFEVS